MNDPKKTQNDNSLRPNNTSENENDEKAGRPLDRALDDSFPASDPPAVTRPTPETEPKPEPPKK